MKVLKFGGSSVGDPKRINKVIGIMSDIKNGSNIAVVVSAFHGITDSLIDMSRTAASGDKEYKIKLAALEDRHILIVKELISMSGQSSVLTRIKLMLNELYDVLHGVNLIKELTDKTLDYIMSFGERLSAFIISSALCDKNIPAEFLDARTIIITDNSFGNAKVNFDLTNKRITDYFSEHKGLQIVTGFISTTLNNETTTLGRGGSDYTAAILGAALNADEIEIWTDVDGVMTADPRKVKKAFSIPSMTYEEAMEMSHFGAKVIHPPTMQPALNKNIPIRIKNSFNPDFPGTLIGKNDEEKKFLIRGISSIDEISLLRVQGSGMIGVAGIAKRIFGALAAANISIILISQGSSEHNICLAVMPQHGDEAKRVIEEELKFEKRDNIITDIILEKNLSIIAVVGENMRAQIGVSGKVFQALGKNGINIIAIAQGSSELNISTVIPRQDESKALNAIHDTFFLSEHKSINLFVVGTGLIGRTLFKQITNQVEFLSNELMIDLKIIAISNSRKMLFNTKGLSVLEWEKIMSSEGEAMNLNEFVRRMKELNLPNSIFVDCTSSEQLLTKYIDILKSSISIVTPNKRANSSKHEFYLQLRHTAQKYNVKFLYETNVGAGLPIISTIQDLVTSGDKVLRIEGVLSGTLSYIFNNYDGSTSFTQVVKDALAKGYTEPDPRDDLNGMDVARKLLILVREAGYSLEMDKIKIQNLIPEEARGKGTVKDFFEILKNYDDHFAKMQQDAVANNKKLRYIAKYEDGNAEVNLQAVDVKHPFYFLTANDNILALRTVYYYERPIVIQGPGAGAEVTSGGILADIIRIGNYLI